MCKWSINMLGPKLQTLKCQGKFRLQDADSDWNRKFGLHGDSDTVARSACSVNKDKVEKVNRLFYAFATEYDPIFAFLTM